MESNEIESPSTLAVVIMAAGKGTRLKSRRPKVLHEIGGKPLLSHVIAAAGRVAKPEDIYAVVGHQTDRVKSAVAATGIRFVDQPEQRGTGHAIQCAREAIAAYDNILVLSGDVPLIRPETIETLWQFHRSQRAAMTILTAFADDPTGYGRIIRHPHSKPDVDAIVEQKPSPLPKRIFTKSTPASTSSAPPRYLPTSTNSTTRTPTKRSSSRTWPACYAPPANA
jgi:bifunctional UDP-N-acetylglucosamine pyrophosphorylase/glucosamine-1-phosphate N-acetyltransferase